MKKSWFVGLDKEQEQDLRVNYTESLVLRKRLEGMLENKINENINTSRSKTSYSNPNWTYLQADSCGYQRALQEIIELI